MDWEACLKIKYWKVDSTIAYLAIGDHDHLVMQFAQWETETHCTASINCTGHRFKPCYPHKMTSLSDSFITCVMCICDVLAAVYEYKPL